VPALDAARVLATLGIVWVHTAEIQGQADALSTLGRFGTSFYILAAVFFAARSHLYRRETKTKDVLRSRAKRLLIPYFLWCVIYAAFYFMTMLPQGYSVRAITMHWGPLYGTAPHLWFLPFAFVAGACASLAVPRLLRLSRSALVGMGTFSTLGAYVLVYRWGYPAIDLPELIDLGLNRVDRWVEEVPFAVGAIFGVAIYGKYLPELSRLGRKRRYRLAWGTFAAFLITQITYALSMDTLGEFFSGRVRFLSNLAGSLWLVTFVAARKSAWFIRLSPFGSATYFAYLFHQLLLDAVKTPLRHVPGHGSLWFALASALGIFVCSFALGLSVSKVRSLRWLNP
jgi:fucose 4-O-acetylase-like acetyltransferase